MTLNIAVSNTTGKEFPYAIVSKDPKTTVGYFDELVKANVISGFTINIHAERGVENVRVVGDKFRRHIAPGMALTFLPNGTIYTVTMVQTFYYLFYDKAAEELHRAFSDENVRKWGRTIVAPVVVSELEMFGVAKEKVSITFEFLSHKSNVASFRVYLYRYGMDFQVNLKFVPQSPDEIKEAVRKQVFDFMNITNSALLSAQKQAEKQQKVLDALNKANCEIAIKKVYDIIEQSLTAMGIVKNVGQQDLPDDRLSYKVLVQCKDGNNTVVITVRIIRPDMSDVRFYRAYCTSIMFDEKARAAALKTFIDKVQGSMIYQKWTQDFINNFWNIDKYQKQVEWNPEKGTVTFTKGPKQSSNHHHDSYIDYIIRGGASTPISKYVYEWGTKEIKELKKDLPPTDKEGWNEFWLDFYSDY